MNKKMKNLITSLSVLSLILVASIKSDAQECSTNDEKVIKVENQIDNLNDKKEIEANILQGRSIDNKSVNLDEFELIDFSENVFAWDYYDQLHGISYYDFGNIDEKQAFIRFIYACSTQYIKSDYVFLEEFKEQSGKAIYQRGWYWDFSGQQSGFMTHYFDKEFYNQEYLYFLFGVADSKYGYYEDYNYFKIKNPFYKQSSQTGWVSDGYYWYYYENGKTIKNQWLKDNNKWYYLDSVGVMKSNCIAEIGGKNYIFDKDGSMIEKNGWFNQYSIGLERYVWYCLNGDGTVKTGWLNLNGTWYYLQSSGAMKTGWLNLYGTWYYLDNNGEMVTGWKLVNRTWYYMYSSGKMATNTTIDGWKIDSSGAATPIK